MPLMTGNRNGNSNNSDANAAPKDKAAPAMVVPFVRASDEHLQPGNVDASRTMTASAQDLGTMDVPAYGYISHLYILVEATGGNNGLATVAADEDAPFNVLQNIALTEPNGAYIVQFNSGYEMYLANKYGGYVNAKAADPKRSPVFSDVSSEGDFTFLLRVPVSLSVRDAVGALANQDSAGQFKFRATIAPSSTVYDTAPDTLPSVRVRAWLAAYDQPEPTSAGVGNQVEPPANGTTSFWSVQAGITVNNGENTIELKRKGNYLRQIIFVLRTSGSRATADTDWPVETRFLRDSFPARYYNDSVWRHIMFERTGYQGTLDNADAPEAGVRFHDYMHEFDGALGMENRDLWQPTRGSTRLDIAGSFQAAATLTIITNDVAIAQNVFL
jgi:hypothetical protein